MTSMERSDDFATRRKHLQSLSDEELHQRFWQLAEQIVAPLITEAKTHTSPSIERSVLLRMGFSSIETKKLVSELQQRELLGYGAGRLIFELAKSKNISIREAGTKLLDGQYWQELTNVK
ncbi:MAG: ornithine aminomutase subunit alpha [Acidiferrobacterales bacterium]|nr:ornithine aminomutase subunit alpha [Acidiferrobacterales bacterium]